MEFYTLALCTDINRKLIIFLQEKNIDKSLLNKDSLEHLKIDDKCDNIQGKEESKVKLTKIIYLIVIHQTIEIIIIE